MGVPSRRFALLERLGHSLRLGLKSLGVHRLRSLLTVMGIVLGVASVIVMLAVGEAARFKAIQQIQDLGATNIIVRSVKPIEDDKKNEGQWILTYGLTIQDLERIRSTIPTITSVTPMREFRKDVRYEDKKVQGRVVGVTPNYLGMNGLSMSQGRFIEELDLERYRNVAVMGAEAAEILFPIEDPIGKSIHVGEIHDYTIIGVTEGRAPSAGIGSSLAAQDYNRDVYIPFSTDQVRFGKTLFTFRPGSFDAVTLEISQLTVSVD